MFDRAVGLTSALFLASSPLFWFYGEVALPHALDAFAVISSVLLLYGAASGEPRLLVPAAFWLGIAGGLRPQTQAFLAPLALYAAACAGWRPALAAAATLIVVDLLWFVPLVQLSGGLDRYLGILAHFRTEFRDTTSVFGAGLFGLERNGVKLGMYTAYGWSLALLPAALGLAAAWRRLGARRVAALAADRRAWVMALWVAPSAAFYLLIHMGQQGLVFVFLPALCLLSSARALSRFLPPRLRRRVGGRVGLCGTQSRRWSCSATRRSSSSRRHTPSAATGRSCSPSTLSAGTTPTIRTDSP
jgi:hypothetical protein